MYCSAANLVIAFDAREITAAEFADAIRFLDPEHAQFALGTLKSIWVHNPENDAQRRRARKLCCKFQMPSIAMN